MQVVSLSGNVIISNNVIKDGGYGISLLPKTSKVTITDNMIINHAFIGIQLQTSSYDVISGNRIEKDEGQGIELSLSSNQNSILNNSIINNTKEAMLVGGITSTEIQLQEITFLITRSRFDLHTPVQIRLRIITSKRVQ
jgi:parallel beta-helix repeat protein